MIQKAHLCQDKNGLIPLLDVADDKLKKKKKESEGATSFFFMIHIRIGIRGVWLKQLC